MPAALARGRNHALLDHERNARGVLIAGNRRPASVIRPAQQCIKSPASQDLEVLACGNLANKAVSERQHWGL